MYGLLTVLLGQTDTQHTEYTLWKRWGCRGCTWDRLLTRHALLRSQLSAKSSSSDRDSLQDIITKARDEGERERVSETQSNSTEGERERVSETQSNSTEGERERVSETQSNSTTKVRYREGSPCSNAF